MSRLTDVYKSQDVDIDTLLEYYMNEYGVLGYGEHLADELKALCEIMGITCIEA